MWFEVTPIQNANDILEHRRARLEELLASGVPSPTLRNDLSKLLADVEQKIHASQFYNALGESQKRAA